jgi:hypothetical protein
MGYQPRNNLVKDESGDLLADSHNVLNRWKNFFSHLLNVHNVSDVRQIKVLTTEPLVPGLSRLEVQIAIAKLKKYKSPDSDQIPAELIQAGGEIRQAIFLFPSDRSVLKRKLACRTLYYCLRSTNPLILFGIRRNCLINGRNQLLYQFTKRVIKLTVMIIVGYHCYQLHTKFYRISSSEG